jgi:peroxin-3
MIQTVSNYFYDRRRGLTKTAGILGGAYLVGRYVRDRLEEVKDKVMQERLARDRCVWGVWSLRECF